MHKENVESTKRKLNARISAMKDKVVEVSSTLGFSIDYKVLL